MKKVAVYLTPLQIAAVEEAADGYPNTILMPARQVRATLAAAENLRRAFKETGEPWPW